MADLQKAAANAAMLGGIAYSHGAGQHYDKGLQTQYFARETRTWAAKKGEIASDVYAGESQGLDRSAFFNWTPVLLRSFSAAKSATGETMPDDWQRVHLLKPESADELPPGAYLRYADNTWIVYKGTNIGSVLADGIVRRCNAVIHTLDWYGNVVEVPMSYAKMGTLGNASHASENSIVAKNYISCVCQRNAVSAAFRENTRIVLGTSAYSMRGVNDFTREFTDDAESIHLMTFTMELSELLPTDNVEMQCADYGSFSWRLDVYGEKALKTGGSTALSVMSVRMGETVTGSEAQPIGYLFASLDENVATVDENGLVTAVGAGETQITVTLAQNPAIRTNWPVSVEAAPEAYTGFTATVPETLGEYESVTLTAAYCVDGEATEEPIIWSFSGPPLNAWGVSVNLDGSRTVTCYAAANTPLTVGVSGPGGTGESREIRLTAG